MSYALDENGTPFLDEDGNNIEFNISYIDTNDWYKHREPIHINDDGHLDNEDRHLIVKDAISQNHAVSKNQLDQLKQEIDNKILVLQESINNLKSQIQLLESKNSPQIPNFINKPSSNQFNPNSN